MKSFSERMGLEPEKFQIQKVSISYPLRNALWNNIYLTYFRSFKQNDNYRYNEGFDSIPNDIRILTYRLWVNYFHRAVDDEFNIQTIIDLVKQAIFNGKYNEVYDLLQFLPNNYELDEFLLEEQDETNRKFCSDCNRKLESHLSAYRFINMEIVPVTSEEEIETIEEVFSNQKTFLPVQIHLKASIRHFSNIENPDYRNSIKESISAVESYCSILTNMKKASLDNGLAFLEKNYNLPPSLKSAFLKLYSYTSSNNGIRHALLEEESNLKQEDAKYMLVICCAFINYLNVKISI